MFEIEPFRMERVHRAAPAPIRQADNLILAFETPHRNPILGRLGNGPSIATRIYRKDGTGFGSKLTTDPSCEIPLGSIVEQGDRVFLQFDGDLKTAPRDPRVPCDCRRK